MKPIKPLYYRVSKGIGRCHPSLKMKRNDFPGLDCGPDGPEAWAKADAWYARWIEINNSLKHPSATSSLGGYISFVRTATHVTIHYVPEQTNKFEIARLSLGEAFESMVIVRGSRQDVADVHARLAQFRTQSGFELAEEVLTEMRQSSQIQKVMSAHEQSGIVERTPDQAASRTTRALNSYPFDITDAQWALILPILAEKGSGGRRTRAPTRATINAIIHHLRSGQPWSRLPKNMPHHVKVRLAYVRLVERDRWERVEEVLRRHVG